MTFRDLETWQVAMDLAECCYRITRNYPREELFGLTSQTRRAAASVPANIAEGYGRQSQASYLHFLRIAQGSLKELETHLLLAERVEVVDARSVAAAMRLCDSVGRLLGALIRSVQQS